MFLFIVSFYCAFSLLLSLSLLSFSSCLFRQKQFCCSGIGRWVSCFRAYIDRWQCPYGVSLTMSLWSVLKEDNWLTSIHITILTTRDPNPRPLLYTLYVVPYYGSLLSVYIGIEKWVINWVMGYKLGNGGTHNPRPLLYTLYMIPLLYTLHTRPQPETPNPRPQLYTLLRVLIVNPWQVCI